MHLYVSFDSLCITGVFGGDFFGPKKTSIFPNENPTRPRWRIRLWSWCFSHRSRWRSPNGAHGMPEPTSHGGLGAEEFAQAGNGCFGGCQFAGQTQLLGSWGKLFFLLQNVIFWRCDNFFEFRLDDSVGQFFTAVALCSSCVFVFWFV